MPLIQRKYHIDTAKEPRCTFYLPSTSRACPYQNRFNYETLRKMYENAGRSLHRDERKFIIMSKTIREKTYFQLVKEYMDLTELLQVPCHFKGGTTNASLALYEIRRKPNLDLGPPPADNITKHGAVFLNGDLPTVISAYEKLKASVETQSKSDSKQRKLRMAKRKSDVMSLQQTTTIPAKAKRGADAEM